MNSKRYKVTLSEVKSFDEVVDRIGPIAARIESDAFQFLSDLPQRLQGIQLTSEEQVQIERLMHELVIAYKGAFNDND